MGAGVGNGERSEIWTVYQFPTPPPIQIVIFVLFLTFEN